MARPAPAVDRTVSLITYLASQPARSFTLSELARRLELNKATAHAMLTALTDQGWLIREPREKVYRLGPALVAIGAAVLASERYVLDVARGHMRSLADNLGLQCVASMTIGEEMVVLAIEGPASQSAVSRPGYRVPLAPPMGAVFLAWAEDEAVERWLARLSPDTTVEHRQLYRVALDAVRARGYAVGLDGDRRRRLSTALEELSHDASDRRIRGAVETLLQELERDEAYLLVELDPSRRYPVNMISAPVFGPDGAVVLSLTLQGFDHDLGPREVPSVARKLVDSAQAVTVAVNGRLRPRRARPGRAQGGDPVSDAPSAG